MYRKAEIVGSSDEGLQAAIEAGISRARKTLCHLDWFEVTEVRDYLGGDDRQDGFPECRWKEHPGNRPGSVGRPPSRCAMAAEEGASRSA